MKKHRLLRAEMLEDRRLLAGDSANPMITLVTNVGDITIELFEEEAPQTVANFLNYVQDDDYVDSIFHRLAPGFVVQGGGFTSSSDVLCDLPCDQPDSINADMFGTIETDDPVQNEFGISNTRGTVAMAKLGGDPDSATSQFFFNLGDNSANLDNQNGGFTVFGCVVDMTVVDQIAGFGDTNLQSINGAFSDVPFFENGTTIEIVRVSEVVVGVLSGNVYNDLSGDGSLGSGESGLPAVTVFLDANDNGILDSGETSTQPTAQGEYSFNVQPGDYTVRTVPISSDFAITTGASEFTQTIELGDRATNLDFGFEYTGESWNNPLDEFDVDGLSGVTPVDAILVINELEAREFSDADTGALLSPTQNTSDLRFFDVFEDGFVAPLDALLIINQLNGSNNALVAPSSGQVTTLPATIDSALSDVDDDDEQLQSPLDEVFAALGN
jgi:peptidyl-prolyl cis-trans isomerase A (cyclophilin A)